MRRLLVYDCGSETPLDAFSRDHVAICRVARDGDSAVLHVRRAAAEAVSLGRFHRRPPTDMPLIRRLTGGRAVAVGPGIVSVTGVFPSLAWLAIGRETPGPDQVLNRALRPLLAVLRGAGVDAFYGGRDLVTWDGAPVAVASFSVLPDGVVIVESHVAVSTSFAHSTAALAEWDPQGLVLHDASAFAGASALERRLPAVDARCWSEQLAEHAQSSFRCDTHVAGSLDETLQEPVVEPAFAALQNERGAIAAGWNNAVAIEMLGAVEAAARIEQGRISALELSGDLIATFTTIAEVEAACVGQPPSRPAAERALLSVLSRPGRFVLGVRDLPGVIARLA